MGLRSVLLVDLFFLFLNVSKVHSMLLHITSKGLNACWLCEGLNMYEHKILSCLALQMLLVFGIKFCKHLISVLICVFAKIFIQMSVKCNNFPSLWEIISFLPGWIFRKERKFLGISFLHVPFGPPY